MKKLKLVMLFAIIGFSSSVFSQEEPKIKLGVNIGIPTGDTSDYYGFNLGVDARYEHPIQNGFTIGLASGYQSYFGKNNNGITVEDLGIIPIAATGRYYTDTEYNFFLGADLGYGIVASGGGNENGGFYYRPQIGIQYNEFDVYAFYQGVSFDNTDINSIGIGATFNIPMN